MHEEQFSLESYADKDYKGFVKDILGLELGLDQVQADYLYDLYMNDDDMSLINPIFQNIVMEMDWTPHYFQRHLELILNYSDVEQDAFVGSLQKYFKNPDEWATTENSIHPMSANQVKEIISSELPFFQILQPVYKELLSEGSLADQPATFASLVDAALREGLVKDKESFLRSYLNKQELEKQAKGEVERSDLSPGLDF
ncbi:TPA: hypothetical protein U1C23_000434 [Streptococcus suis]|nr:hypothetical protein [Streptococcus suis]